MSFDVDSEVQGFDHEDELYRIQLEKELEAWGDSLQSGLEYDPNGNVLSAKQKEQTGQMSDLEMKALLFRKCRTQKELRNWIKIFLRIDLPDTCVDPDSTSNPMDMVWKLYETAVWYDDVPAEDRLIKSLFYCSRGSFKTLGACVVELLIMLHAQRDTVHIGLIESQAKTAYNKYFRPFLDLPFVKEWVRKSTTLNRSELVTQEQEFIGGAYPEMKQIDPHDITTLEVIPLTMNKTSSPRAHLICKDEIDKCKGEQVMAYENAYGMLTMTNDKKMAMEFDISSRDSAFGKVQDLIDSADKTGCKVYHWNRIDITEKCPDSRSGKKPIKIYIKKDTLTAISELEYKQTVTPDEQKHWDEHWGLDGCLKNCKMFAACRGYLKNQTSKCKWLKPVEETEKAILSAPSEQMALAQLLCRLPPTSGLVYSDFKKKKNVREPREMYKQYKGVYPDSEHFTTDDMIKVFRRDGLPCYIGVDAGFHNPACVLVYINEKGKDEYGRPQDDIYVVKEHMPHEVDSPELAAWLKDNWLKYRPRRVFVDVESPDAVRAIRKAGFTVPEKLDKKRQPGIATVKGFIKPPASGENFTQMYVNAHCKGMLFEFSRWSYKEGSDGKATDDAEKSNDHSMDALRYILHSLYGKSRGNLDQGHKKVEELPFEEQLKIAKKEVVTSQISPKAVSQRQGFTVHDNRKEEALTDEEAERKRAISKYDIGSF